MLKYFFLFFICVIQSEAQVLKPQGLPTYTGIEKETNSSATPDQLKGVAIKEKLGQQIDLDLTVRNESGQPVTLGSFFRSGKPILLSPVYFNCPGLCNFHFNGVIETLKKIDWNPSDKFDVIAFSFDSKETADVALNKKNN